MECQSYNNICGLHCTKCTLHMLYQVAVYDTVIKVWLLPTRPVTKSQFERWKTLWGANVKQKARSPPSPPELEDITLMQIFFYVCFGTMWVPTKQTI
jgi:hypothetical protein